MAVTSRPNRRAVMTALSTSAATVLTAAIPGRTPRPARASGFVTLRLALDWEGLPAMASSVPRIMAPIIERFEARHPGTRVQAVAGDCSNSSNYSQPDEASAIIGGRGFDVFSICGPTAGSFVEQNLVLPLDQWLQQDNISTTRWPGDAIGRCTYGNQLYYLPSELQPRTFVYNRGLLDSMGIAQPAPTWSYTQSASIWRAVAGQVSGKRRYGAMLPVPHSIRTWAYLAKGFGGALQDSSYRRATFSDPRVVAAGSWLVEELVWANTVMRGSVYNHSAQFVSGQVVFSDAPVWSLAVIADSVRGVDWSFIPYPVFPHGPATIDTGNAYGVSAATRRPELAWELLKWLCVDPTYWRYEVRVSLNTPGQVSLWPEWERVVLDVVPPLRGKGLQHYTEAVTNGWGIAGHPFSYADSQASAIIGQWSSAALAHRMSVSEACQRIDAQVNALEATAGPQQTLLAKETAAAQAQLNHVRDGASAAFRPPSAAGIGRGYRPAAALFSVRRSGYTIQGAATGVSSTADTGTFVAQAETAPAASYICRLAGLAVSDGSALAKGAAAGLMWRGDLSADAAMGLLAVTGQGVVLEWRQVPTQALQTSLPATATAPSGLIGTREIIASPPGRTGILRKPVWLRVVRNLASWTPYTSVDGVHWTQAGSALVLQTAGVWVGLFVTAAAPSTSPHALLVGDFDHVRGFVPTEAVVLGGAASHRSR